jgi:hypothetical protein
VPAHAGWRARVHALNVLKQLFGDARLAEDLEVSVLLCR